MNSMNVYQRLNFARDLFHAKELKKSGENKFAGYRYFELADFVQPALKIFKEIGLCSVISFHEDRATMTIVNTDDKNDFIIITSPMAEANLKGCHPVQNLGATQTYIRRYLWICALEVIEHDSLDATTGSDKVEKPAPKKQPVNYAEFVDTMKNAGQACKSAEDLTNLWKANQRTIDEVKKEDRGQYKILVDLFGELKNNFKE